MNSFDSHPPLMLTLIGIIRAMQKTKRSNPPTGPVSTSSLFRMISIILSHVLELRHPERLIHTLDEMPRPATPSHYPALFKQSIHRTRFAWHSAEEDFFAVVDVFVYDFGQDLCAGAVDRRDAMDVENDIFVVLRCSHAWQGRVGGVGAVEFESPETVFEIAGVGKGEGFGYFDDQTAFDELEGLRIELGVLELVLCAWHFAQDLNPRFR